ncbi:MAG: hypothetical protein MRY60_14530 [Algiphilus sp.]|uniref:hypothetical protein n=1 Tax=Algiphilus sp. TaxID=1872431 RepID=UPI0025C566DC|nr:hypothetical protein [Algiphilus sp.]MCI5104979.1 hypothetical protein [Algiphilus sp.]
MRNSFLPTMAMLVALSVLLSGVAWSAHLDLPVEHDSTVAEAHAHAEGGKLVSGCDHCCHASAHLVALTSNIPLFVSVPAGDYHATVPAGIRPPALEPPFTPPIA